MPKANYDVGQSFRVQFVWRLPDGDFLRAFFDCEVMHQDSVSDKYVLRLNEFSAGRQESSSGVMRAFPEVNKQYWAKVVDLEGNKISLAFEADDGRPLWLRLETLTGEHNFFRRLNEVPPQLQQILEERKKEEPDVTDNLGIG